jgi:3-dehydroquinate synthetase
MNRIKVNLDKRSAHSYEIFIGQDILNRTALIITKGNWAERYIVVTDTNVSGIHGENVLNILL